MEVPAKDPGPGQVRVTVQAASVNGIDAYGRDLGAAVRAIAPDGVTAVLHAAGDPAQLGALLRPGGRLASVLGATDEQVGRDDVTVAAVLATDTPEKVRGLLAAVAGADLQVPVAQTFAFDHGSCHHGVRQPKLGKLAISMA